MTTCTITAMLLASLAGAVDLTDLIQQIRDNQYQQIVVCPRPIILVGDRRTSVDDIAMLATEQIEQITNELLQNRAGQYQVLDAETALSAVEGLTLDGLNDPDVRRRIGTQTGADAMVFVFAEKLPDGDQWDLYWQLVELRSASIAAKGQETLDILLSDAAYMGESFEVRRWVNGRVEGVGFRPQIPRDWTMGVGPQWERLQYTSLAENLPHPLETPNIPYGIQLVVGGQPQQPQRICDKLYVPIDPPRGPNLPGADVGIRMFNFSGQEVFMAIYIDGVNMINQQRELPILTPTERHWVVRDGYDATLRHWYQLNVGRVAQKSRFQLVAADQSVAAGQPPAASVGYGSRIDDRLGTVTCLVYTSGWENVGENRSPAPMRGLKPRFAFGEGRRQAAEIRWLPRERGILLAAMTLHYRTPVELQQIRAMGCGDESVHQPLTDERVDKAPDEAQRPVAPVPVAPVPVAPSVDAIGTSLFEPAEPPAPGEHAPFPVFK